MLNILIYIFNLIYFEIMCVTQKSRNPSPPQAPLMYLNQIIQSKSDKINPKQMLVIVQIHLCFDCATSDKTRRDLDSLQKRLQLGNVKRHSRCFGILNLVVCVPFDHAHTPWITYTIYYVLRCNSIKKNLILPWLQIMPNLWMKNLHTNRMLVQ